MSIGDESLDLGWTYFGRREGDDLWTHGGRHVERVHGDEVYAQGHHLGKLRNDDQLITSTRKQNRRQSSFTPHGSRVKHVPLVDYVGYVMVVGCEDFPAPEVVNISAAPRIDPWFTGPGCAGSRPGDLVVSMVNIENIYKRALADSILLAGDDLGVARPHQVELGEIGLKDMPLSLQQPVKGWERIYENEFKLRRVLYDTGLGNQRGAVEEFLDQLYGGRDGMTVVMLEFGRQEAANLARKEMAALGVPEPGRPRALTCQVSPAARG